MYKQDYDFMLYTLMTSKKLLRFSVGAAIALVMLAVLTVLALPHLLQYVAQNKGSELLGRQIHVGHVDFSPWSLELTATDVSVDTADGLAKQLEIDRVYVNLELQSLLRLAPVVQAVELDAPKVLLTHLGEGHYDIDDVVARLNTPSESSGTARYALYNIRIQGGAVNFIDRNPSIQTERSHTIRDFTLSLPFISNLDTYQAVDVTPHMAFKLNDVPFDTSALGTPFSQTPKGGLTLKVAGLRLEPYLSYLPPSLPFKIKKGVLDTDVQIDFEQPPAPASPKVRLRGTIKLSDTLLHNARGQTLLQCDAVQINMADVRPLERLIRLADVRIIAPVAQVVRHKDGGLNWALPASKSPVDQSESATDGLAWTLQIARLSIKKGAVQGHDLMVHPGSSASLLDIDVKAKNVHWPASESAKIEGSLRVAGQGNKEIAKPAKLDFEAQGTDQDAAVHLKLQGLGLGLANPYLTQYLKPLITGRLNAEIRVQWKNQNVSVAMPMLAVQDFALQSREKVEPNAGQTMPSFGLLEVKDAKFDLQKQHVDVGSIQLQKPYAFISRDAQGKWDLMRWFSVAPAVSVQEPIAQKSIAPKQLWKLRLGQFQLDNGAVRWEDRSTLKRVRLTVSKLHADLKNLYWDGKSLAPQAMPLVVSADVQSGRTEPGSIDYRGTLSVMPEFQAQGAFTLREVPLHALYPYVADQLNMDVLRADANAQGTIQFAIQPTGIKLGLNTDASLDDVRIKTVSKSQGQDFLGLGEELLRWKSLHLPGLVVSMAPQMSTVVLVKKVVWSDFYARLVVDNTGRLNLQDVLKNNAEDATTATANAAPAADSVSDTPGSYIYLGPIQLVNGKVDFTDQFIQPNYSADLTDLNGSLSQVTSVPTDGQIQMAELSLRGRAEGTAQLEIVGKLNPLVKPLALDIQGKVNDLELPPLSSYSAKYAGYGIERGKLSMNVSYNIQPNGYLQASNQIVLNQLTFGDKEPTSAKDLPVKLAVALLQDSNGVININFPISGSMDDPEFQIGPILGKVFGNIIQKAVSSPFSLLASVVSSDGDVDIDPSRIAFAAGSTGLTESARLSLDKLAKVIAQKKELLVVVTGSAHDITERPAMLRAQLQQLLQNHKRRRADVAASNATQDAMISPEEYPILLKEVYRRADMSKPKNALGVMLELTVPEMEELMLAHIKLPPDATRNLALERSVVVKEYLLTQQIPKERLFLGAVKTLTGDDATAGAEISFSLP